MHRIWRPLGTNFQRTQPHIANLETEFTLRFQDEDGHTRDCARVDRILARIRRREPVHPEHMNRSQAESRPFEGHCQGTLRTRRERHLTFVAVQGRIRVGVCHAADDGERVPTHIAHIKHQSVVLREIPATVRCLQDNAGPRRVVLAVHVQGHARVGFCGRDIHAAQLNGIVRLATVCKSKQHRLSFNLSGADQYHQHANPSDHQAVRSRGSN